MRRMYTTEGIQKLIDDSIKEAFENDVELGGDLDVAGDLDITGDAKLFENIVDKDGHKRFVEGQGNIPSSQSGVNILYNKYSLSGSHIMFVLAGEIKAGDNMSNDYLALYNLPEWITNKIVNVFSSDHIIEYKTLKIANSDGTNAQNIQIGIGKNSDNQIYIYPYSASTIQVVDQYFRIQFDLLIDNE